MTEGKKGKGNPVHRRPSASAPPPVFHPPCQVKDYESTFPSRIQSLTLWQAGSGRRVVLASAPPGILLEEVLAAEGGTQGSTRVDISSITFVASFLVPGTPPKVMKKSPCVRICFVQILSPGSPHGPNLGPTLGPSASDRPRRTQGRTQEETAL